MNLPKKWDLFSPQQKDRYTQLVNELSETYKIDNPTTIGGFASNRYYQRVVNTLGNNPDAQIADVIPTMLTNYEKTIDSLSLYGSNPSIANVGGKRYSISPTGMVGEWHDNGAYDLGFTLDPLDPNDKVIDPTKLFHELNPNFEKEFSGINEQIRLEKMQQVMDFIDDMGITLEGSTRAELTQQLKDVNKQRREISKNTPNYNASYTVDEMKQMFPNFMPNVEPEGPVISSDVPKHGGGGGKKPPEKKPTATPEPPERGKKQNTQKQNRRRNTTKNNSTYNIENIVPDYSNPLPENIQRSLDLANPNPNISNPQVSNYGRSNPQYQGTTGGSTVKPSVFNMPGPEPIPTGMGPTRQKVDPLTADERETIESLLNETQSKFDAKEITEEQYYSELEEIQNMYTEIENKYWKAEERKYDKRTPEGRQTEFNKKIDDIEKRYANGDLTDDEYISELQKAHDKYDYDSNRPNDHSNVLNNPPEKPLTEEERARKLYEDAMNGNLENVPEHAREVMDAYRMEDERIAKEAEEKAKADREMEEIKKKEKEIYDNRIYDEDEYKRLEEELIEKFNNGDITEEELKKQWAELDKRYQPITKEELEEQIEEGTKPDARPESNPFHRDMDKFDSTIEKQFKGEGYEGNIKNGYVQDITVGDKTYNIKHRADDNTIDVFDSDGNVIADQDILKDVNSKVFDETNNFYKNLSDEEWDTVINNAKDYRFDKHKASDTITEREAKMLNTNDAIEKRKAILDEQREAIVKNAETAKGKKKKEALNKQRNTIDIKKHEADRIKKTNEHKLEAGQRRRAARSKFNKSLGLDAFEEGSQEFKDALNSLKGTDEYVEAMAKFKKDLKGIDKIKRTGIKEVNRTIDAQISALSGKGLTINNAITVASAAIGAVNKYKESRAEGKGVVSSAARAGATAIAAEVLGPGAAVAVMGARMAGNALTEAGDAIYKENRRMNSASNFRVFGGASFQDSQELATMRQSGMELAKMSQYNLEQTLMGAEAKHLHR